MLENARDSQDIDQGIRVNELREAAQDVAGLLMKT